MRKLSMVVVLTLACATYGFAGIIPTPPEPPPPSSPQSAVAAIVVALVQIVVR